jgi:hypothetical protein
LRLGGEDVGERPARAERRRRGAPKPAKGVHERDLRRVLGFLAVAELVLAEAQDLVVVARMLGPSGR